MTSRVVPAIGVTIARLLLVSRLKSVDFPTFGLPTSTTDGKRFMRSQQAPSAERRDPELHQALI